MNGELRCRACHLEMAPGEALRVTPVDGSPEYVLHRYGLGSACWRGVGPRRRWTIALFAAAAARAYDHASNPSQP